MQSNRAWLDSSVFHPSNKILRLWTCRAGSKVKIVALHFLGNVKWPHIRSNIKHEEAKENMPRYYACRFPSYLFLPSLSYSKFDIIKIRVTFLPIRFPSGTANYWLQQPQTYKDLIRTIERLQELKSPVHRQHIEVFTHLFSDLRWDF